MMVLGQHLRTSRSRHPQRIALVCGDRTWTYAELDDVTDTLAINLAGLGIRPGDRVALQLANSPELVLAYYACFKFGAISVPVNNRFAPAEIEYTLQHSESRVCISQSDLYANLLPIRDRLSRLEHSFLIDESSLSGTRPFSELLRLPDERVLFPEVASHDVAAIMYTSGTTSRPKCVTHTHSSLHATVDYHGTSIGLRADDVICVIPPMCHILGFSSQMLAGIWAGAKLVLVPRVDPESVLSTIQRHHGTRIAALPVLLQSLVNFGGKEQYRIDSIRTCVAGGDAVPVALQKRFQEVFGVPENPA